MGDTTDSDELALLLCDPELREFLTHYLAIPDEEGRARVRRVAAELSSDTRTGDVERRKRLKLSPRTARKSVA
ncbi:MAG: hypothetical protein ABL996_11475 [Micropepsaceae bacterium]